MSRAVAEGREFGGVLDRDRVVSHRGLREEMVVERCESNYGWMRRLW